MTVADPRATARFLGAFFDELAKWGVQNVVISPGSRSTPLSMIAYELSCRAPQRMSTYVDIDERGAAFLALGMAMLSSAITVYFRDLEHILGIVTMVWSRGRHLTRGIVVTFFSFINENYILPKKSCKTA